MKLTLDSYIENPIAATNGGRVMSAYMRNAQLNAYTDSFNKLLLRENGMIVYKQYQDERNKVYYIHLKMPSESTKGLVYDVLLRFYSDSKTKDIRNLSTYYFEVYSNDPAFIFTYAYVFSRNGLVPNDFLSKIGKLARTKAPDISNPNQQIGYVKSIVYSYLFMKNRGLLNLIQWTDVPKYIKSDLFKVIDSTDDKLKELKDEKERLRELKNYQQEKKKQIDNFHKENSPNGRAKKINIIKPIQKIAKIKPISKIKK